MDSLQAIQYELALLVRLITSHSPQLGSLDRSEYLILCELEDSGPFAINEIAEKLMLNISTASRQVGTLETKKYIRRYPDPTNGRISLIEITAPGLEVLQRVQNARYDFYREILHEWSPEKLKDLESNLSQLNFDLKKGKRKT